MHWKISPSKLQGTLQIPPSKSQSIRALLFALLGHGKSVITNLLPSPDIQAMLTACTHLGARVKKIEPGIEITGVGGKISGAEDVIQAGNSGLILRFIGALAGLSTKPIVITGDNSIRHKRPLTPLLEALCQLGVEALSTRGDGGAPIIVKGPIHPGITTLCGQDSQPVSAMLLAAAFAPGAVEIAVTNPGEKPWVNLTLHWFDRCQIPYTRRDFTYYKLQGNASIEGFSYRVPADLSSLAYPLVAALLTGSELKIENIDLKDAQGDKLLLNYLQMMGASIEMDAQTLIVKKVKTLQGVSLDVNDCIDATPLLAVVGCFAEGKTEITSAAIARKKECDRLSCITQELRKMGATIEEHANGLVVYPSKLKGAIVHSHSDHRMALSLSVAALAAQGETLITHTTCVEKSFPNFCRTMQKLGAQLQVVYY